MKRVGVLLVALMLLLCGCASGLTIEDMLTAPALTADQSSVISAIDGSTGEKTVLKYPTSGDRRSPIQFVDLDADGFNEAVVFFSVPSEDLYAKVAVLKKVEGEWNIVSSETGAGTDVESISVIRLADSANRFLLVEWSSISSREHQLTAYYFSDGSLQLGFGEACSDILVFDVDSDGYREFCYITEGSSFEPFRIKFVDNSDGQFTLMGECELNEQLLSINAINAGTLADGRRALFLDENIADGVKHTEIVLLDEQHELVSLRLAQDNDLFTLTTREAQALDCTKLHGGDRVYIPTDALPAEGILHPEQWVYWYTVRANEAVFCEASYIDTTYGFSLAVPDAWLETTHINRYSDDPRLIGICEDKLDVDIVQLRVLELGEESSKYINDGLEYLYQSGSYRYYIKGVCEQQDMDYIKSNFALI